MRVSYTEEQLFMHGLAEETRSSKFDDLNSVLGYTFPDWVLESCHNGMGGPSASHDIILHFTTDDHDGFEYYCSHQLRDWFNFVEDRGGSERMVLMLRDWFTFEDLIFYQIAYDEEGGHMLSYWNPLRQTRLKTRPARFYQNIMGRPSYLGKQFAEAWQEVIIREETALKKFTVTRYSRSEDIGQAYMSMQDTHLSSCMCYKPERFSTGGIHPAEVYGGDSKVDLIVIKDKDDELYSRTLITDEGYVRVYPAGVHKVSSVTREILKTNGLPHEPVSLMGTELNYLEHPDHCNVVVCPYIDGNGSYVKVSTRADGKKILKCTSDSVNGMDTQSDSMYEYMAFDSDTMRVFRENYDYHCDMCSDGFYESDNDVIFPDGSDNSFCSSSCAREADFEYAYCTRGDMEWVNTNHDFVVYYDGDHYHIDCLSEYALCLCQDNIVRREEDCISTTNGWYAEIDCLFINSVDEYKQAEELNRTPVWMLPDEYEAGVGSLTSYLHDTGEQQ